MNVACGTASSFRCILIGCPMYGMGSVILKTVDENVSNKYFSISGMFSSVAAHGDTRLLEIEPVFACLVFVVEDSRVDDVLVLIWSGVSVTLTFGKSLWTKCIPMQESQDR